MSNPSPAHAHHFDEVDPHGEGLGHGHGHHISPGILLKVILGILLFFTVLTVGAANLETWASNKFHFEFPLWVNVIVALSIAVVKSTLVLMYFMHLRHDNPINSVIFFVTLIAFAIFLSFTFIDVGNRGYVDPTKAAHKWLGYNGVKDDGTVDGTTPPPFLAAIDRRFTELTAKHSAGVSEEQAKEKAREALAEEFRHHVHQYGLPHEDVVKRLAHKDLLGPAVVADIKAEAAGHAGEHGGEAKGPESSSSDRSRPKKGKTIEAAAHTPPHAPGH